MLLICANLPVTRSALQWVTRMAHFSMPNVIGYIGVFVVLLYYFLMLAHKLDVHGLAFSVANLLASILILYSLYYSPNLPSIVIEIAWSAISIYGVVNYFLHAKSQQ